MESEEFSSMEHLFGKEAVRQIKERADELKTLRLVKTQFVVGFFLEERRPGQRSLWASVSPEGEWTTILPTSQEPEIHSLPQPRTSAEEASAAAQELTTPPFKRFCTYPPHLMQAPVPSQGGVSPPWQGPTFIPC